MIIIQENDEVPMNCSQPSFLNYFAPFCHEKLIVLLLIAILGLAATAKAKDNEVETSENKVSSFPDALKKGKLTIDLRYRYEYVTDDTTALSGKDAKASTLRTAVGYCSRPFLGFAGFVEFENVSVIGPNSYNNKGEGHLSNGVADRPVVADPKLTEVNQAYVSLTMIPGTVVHVGREEIVLDNVRFLGNVAWRQNHQSFDDISVINTSIPKTTITYAHLFRVNRIFGDHKPMDSNLLNARVRISQAINLSAYAYLLDYSDENDFGLSTNTYGIRFNGRRGVNQWDFLYDLEYAKQVDGRNNPKAIDANYYRLEAGTALSGTFSVNAGLEVLGGKCAERATQHSSGDAPCLERLGR